MAFQLAQAFIDIHARTAKIQAQIAQLKSQLNRQLGGLNVGTAIERVLGRFVLLRAAFAGVVTSGREFVKFDKNMVNQMAIQGDIAEDLQRKMSSLAQTLAIQTGQSAADLAEGFYFLASAGMTAEQQITALPIAANFATAGLLDMGKATSILSDALKSSGLESADAAENMVQFQRVADVITKASILTNATVEQMGTSVARAGAAVTTFGLSFEEAVASLGVFANVAKKAGLGSTALLGALRDLQTNTIKHRAAWDNAGVSVFDATGKFIGLGKALQNLEFRMAGMSDEATRGFLRNVLKLPDKSIGFVTSILHMGKALDVLTEELMHAGGTAEMVANKQMESLSKQAVKLAQQFLSLTFNVMQPFAQVLLAPLKILGFMSDAFVKLNTALAGIPVKTIAAISAALLLMGGVGTALKSVGKAFTFFFPATAKAVIPFLKEVVGEIKGIPTTLLNINKLFGAWTDGMLRKLPLVGGLLVKMRGGLAGVGGALVSKLPKAAQGFAGKLLKAFGAVGGAIGIPIIGLAKILDFFHKISVIGPAIEKVFDLFASLLEGIPGIGGFLGKATRLIGDIVSRIIGIPLGAAFATQFTRIFSGIAKGLAGSALFKALTSGIHELGDVFHELGRIIVKIVESVADAFAAGVVGTAKWAGGIIGLDGKITSSMGSMLSGIATTLRVFADNWQTVWRIMADSVNVAVFQMKAALLDFLAVQAKVADFWGDVRNFGDFRLDQESGKWTREPKGAPAKATTTAENLDFQASHERFKRDEAEKHLKENLAKLADAFAREENKRFFKTKWGGGTDADAKQAAAAAKSELPTFVAFEELQKQLQEQMSKQANPQLEQIHQDLVGVHGSLQQNLMVNKATATNTSKALPPGTTGTAPPAGGQGQLLKMLFGRRP